MNPVITFVPFVTEFDMPALLPTFGLEEQRLQSSCDPSPCVTSKNHKATNSSKPRKMGYEINLRGQKTNRELVEYSRGSPNSLLLNSSVLGPSKTSKELSPAAQIRKRIVMVFLIQSSLLAKFLTNHETVRK